MVCSFLKSTCFGALPDGCVSFPTMTYIGYENGAGSADVQVLSSTDLGVLLSGVGEGGSVRWSSSTCDLICSLKVPLCGPPGVLLVMLCASAASCQLKRLCKGLAAMSAKKNGNDLHMEGQRVEWEWKRDRWVSPFFPRRQPECLREMTHRPFSGGSMGQFGKETCGSVSAPGKAPKSDTAKWQTDPPRGRQAF